MNKTRVKDGILLNARAIFAFIAPAFGVLGAILLLVAVGVAVHSLVTDEEVWKRLAAAVAGMAGLVASVLASISLTQWILILLVWIGLAIRASNRKILAKLEDIESEWGGLSASARTRSYDDEDFGDS